MAEIPHWAWPLSLAGRRLRQVEQDSIEDVQQSVHSYLATGRGERPLSPEFGIEDPTFGPDVNTSRLAAEIIASEDGRADVTVTRTGPDARGRMSIVVAVGLAE